MAKKSKAKAEAPVEQQAPKVSKEAQRLADWRHEAWLALGYRHAWAEFLSGTQVDLRTAERMLEKGASRDQVVQILAGYGPLDIDPHYDWARHDALLSGVDELEPDVAEDDDESPEDEREMVAAGDGAVGKD